MVRHVVPFAAEAFTSAQLSLSGFNQFRTARRHVVLRRPLFLVPCGFHSSAAFVVSLGGFLSVCPTDFYEYFLFFKFLLIWASA
jgi:hypothetical protein